jgi:hypothetical protein
MDQCERQVAVDRPVIHRNGIGFAARARRGTHDIGRAAGKDDDIAGVHAKWRRRSVGQRCPAGTRQDGVKRNDVFDPRHDRGGNLRRAWRFPDPRGAGVDVKVNRARQVNGAEQIGQNIRWTASPEKQCSSFLGRCRVRPNTAALGLCLSSWRMACGRVHIGPPISRAKEPDDLPLQPRAAGVAFPGRHQFRLLHSRICWSIRTSAID